MPSIFHRHHLLEDEDTANLLFTAHNAFILINGKAWFLYLSMLSSTNFKLTHVL